MSKKPRCTNASLHQPAAVFTLHTCECSVLLLCCLQIIVDAIGSLGSSKGSDLICLIQTREKIKDLLALHDVIDLVIPRGSNALVTDIQQNTKIPVLGHADGICHVYVDSAADMDKAVSICLDSKVDYPAACNAVETVLVHASHVQSGGLSRIQAALTDAGVKVSSSVVAHAC